VVAYVEEIRIISANLYPFSSPSNRVYYRYKLISCLSVKFVVKFAVGLLSSDFLKDKGQQIL
jgi:hypothetical protein